jgi:hypothetical protein
MRLINDSANYYRNHIDCTTHLHVHLRNRIVAQILVVSFVQDFVVIERDSSGSKHVRQERELLLFEALVEPFFVVPIFILGVG